MIFEMFSTFLSFLWSIIIYSITHFVRFSTYDFMFTVLSFILKLSVFFSNASLLLDVVILVGFFFSFFNDLINNLFHGNIGFEPFVIFPLKSSWNCQLHLIHERNVLRKKSGLCLNQGPRKSRFPLNVADRRTDIWNNRAASLLKICHICTYYCWFLKQSFYTTSYDNIKCSQNVICNMFAMTTFIQNYLVRITNNITNMSMMLIFNAT